MIMDDKLRKFTIEFLASGKHKLTPEKFLTMSDVVFLDVRTKEEFETLNFNFKYYNNIETINIPLNELPDRFGELPKNKSIAIWCPGNFRSSMAYTYLLSKDYENSYILIGGFSELGNNLKAGGLFKVINR